MSIIDDYSRKVFLYLRKRNSQAFDKFRSWKLFIEKQTNRQVKAFTMNNGLEFCNHEFKQFCESNGILRPNIVTYTPQQNGVTERMNRTLLNKVKCLLTTSGST